MSEIDFISMASFISSSHSLEAVENRIVGIIEGNEKQRLSSVVLKARRSGNDYLPCATL